MQKRATTMALFVLVSAASIAQTSQINPDEITRRSIRVMALIGAEDVLISGVVIQPDWILTARLGAPATPVHFHTTGGVHMKPILPEQTWPLVVLYAQGLGRGLPPLSISHISMTVGDNVRCVSGMNSEPGMNISSGIVSEISGPTQFRVIVNSPEYLTGGAVYGADDKKLVGILIGANLRIQQQQPQYQLDGTGNVMNGASIVRILEITRGLREPTPKTSSGAIKLFHQ